MQTGAPFPTPVRATYVPENRRAADNINGFSETSAPHNGNCVDNDRSQIVEFVYLIMTRRIANGAFLNEPLMSSATYHLTRKLIHGKA